MFCKADYLRRHRCEAEEPSVTLFRLDASIRTEGSVTRQLADAVERTWQAEHPQGAVVRRDIGRQPLPAGAWEQAVHAGWTAADRRTPEQASARALAASLADEVLDADAYLFAVPLYNFGVPHHVKSWVDLLIADPRLGPGQQPLAGRPAVLVLARGGGYGPGTPREGWDHGTPWLRRIFADVFGLDLHVAEAELTLAEVKPEMAPLRGLAEQSLRDAHAAAQAHGRTVAQRVGVAA
jgi:FMN-dependent NADH-azoreductase